MPQADESNSSEDSEHEDSDSTRPPPAKRSRRSSPKLKKKATGPSKRQQQQIDRDWENLTREALEKLKIPKQHVSYYVNKMRTEKWTVLHCSKHLKNPDFIP